MPWIVAQTGGGGEYAATAALRERGYDAYYPRCVVTRNHSRKLVPIEVPLFPRYLFVRDCYSRDSIRRIRGVQSVLMVGDRYSTMRDTDMDAIRARENSAGLVEIEGAATPRRLRLGQSVTIASGPYEGIAAAFVCYRGRDRAEIMLRLLGGERMARISVDALDAA